jgi:hypothetical protein
MFYDQESAQTNRCHEEQDYNLKNFPLHSLKSYP